MVAIIPVCTHLWPASCIQSGGGIASVHLMAEYRACDHDRGSLLRVGFIFRYGGRGVLYSRPGICQLLCMIRVADTKELLKQSFCITMVLPLLQQFKIKRYEWYGAKRNIYITRWDKLPNWHIFSWASLLKSHIRIELAMCLNVFLVLSIALW